MKALLFDTETTGTDEDDQIIEAAWAEVDLVAEPGGEPIVDNLARERFCPTVPIKLSAMATHHIIPDDLVGCRPSSEFKLPINVLYLVGHNVDFDWRMAKNPLVKRICTLALARKAWPTLDSHSQTALMYYLHGPVIGRNVVQRAHSAVVDVQNLAFLFAALVRHFQPTSWEHLYEISEEARIPTHMRFGKHKDELIADLPSGYKDWMLKQKDMDPYVLIAVRRTLSAPAAKAVTP